MTFRRDEEVAPIACRTSDGSTKYISKKHRSGKFALDPSHSDMLRIDIQGLGHSRPLLDQAIQRRDTPEVFNVSDIHDISLQDSTNLFIDVSHQFDLIHALEKIILVDTHSVYPEEIDIDHRWSTFLSEDSLVRLSKKSA